nr:hypothetical protein L203_06103 [Cryptococcus depauperatus CBS 7841]
MRQCWNENLEEDTLRAGLIGTAGKQCKTFWGFVYQVKSQPCFNPEKSKVSSRQARKTPFPLAMNWSSSKTCAITLILMTKWLTGMTRSDQIHLHILQTPGVSSFSAKAEIMASSDAVQPHLWLLLDMYSDKGKET